MSHYKPYPAYKDSGVAWLGKVPEHWVIASVRHRYSVVGGSTPQSDNQEYWDGDITWITPSDLSKLKVFEIKDSERKITKRGLDSCGTTLVPTGSVILSTRAPIGSIGIADKSLCTNQGCKALVIQGEDDSRYLAYTFSVSTAELNIRGRGATFLELSADELGSFRMAFPSASEQQAIAAHLDRETARIDALVEKKTRFIELLREKRQALITHAVTKGLDPNVKMKDSGVEWLGEVPEAWKVVRFRDLCTSISTGPFGTALGNDDYVTDGVPVINPSHIVDSKIVADVDVSVSNATAERLCFWRLAEGDLIAARRGELGRAAIVTHKNDGWLCGTGSLRVRPKLGKSSVRYLHAVLQSRYAREWLNQSSVGATMANLNEGILGGLPVALPMEVLDQEKVVEGMALALKRVDVLAEATERSIELLKERRSALITAAVTGQIDLRETA